MKRISMVGFYLLRNLMLIYEKYIFGDSQLEPEFFLVLEFVVIFRILHIFVVYFHVSFAKQNYEDLAEKSPKYIIYVISPFHQIL